MLVVSTYGAVSDVQAALAAGALGRTNQQIAAGLFISQTTVKTHLNHIFGKLGVANRTEAVTVARSRHLIRG
ncbi:helix-turn-helix transcriptional regulator [Citricoccus alkalitolerans]|uniref:Helix-turn-helix transcriptional regulator n=1 Tax=Citricoccus alkalitolerans TaxID=246603 RepID=A0ABV8XYY3_9MICC